MKKLSVLLAAVAVILSCAAVVQAQEDIAAHKVCEVCGMDRAKMSFSRVTLEYADGTRVGVCSIHCATAYIALHPGKYPRTFLVADYNTGKLINAEKAVWVIGGRKEGAMTRQAKWAFSDRVAAGNFMAENGGESADFDRVMKAAYVEMYEDARTAGDGSGAKAEGHAHAGHDMGHMGHDMSKMGPGAQMLYNPAFGDDIYHTHPAGEWMVNYKFMHTNMNGLRDGTSNVDTAEVGYKRNTPYEYMMIPTSMTMDMHMFMVMYGITDDLTVMGTANYQVNSMSMLMDMGPMMGISEMAPMTTSGFGDTELRGIYKINSCFNGSLGFSFPTGSIDETVQAMGRHHAPYDMQLGSGTVDIKPALTYSQLSDDALWNWGAQAQYVHHIAENSNDWSYGDSVKTTAWIQRALGPFTGWTRFVYSYAGEINGQDPEIRKLLQEASMPDADPENYGGQRLDWLLGVSFVKGPFSIGVEGGIPAYQNLNGLQLKTDWLLTVGGQVMF